MVISAFLAFFSCFLGALSISRAIFRSKKCAKLRRRKQTVNFEHLYTLTRMQNLGPLFSFAYFRSTCRVFVTLCLTQTVELLVLPTYLLSTVSHESIRTVCSIQLQDTTRAHMITPRPIHNDLLEQFRFLFSIDAGCVSFRSTDHSRR